MDSEHKAVSDILVAAYEGVLSFPFRILETGMVSTRAIAKWIRDHAPDSAFVSVSLDGRLQESVHAQLEVDGTAKYCTFLTQDPIKKLSTVDLPDVIFLDPPNLARGLEQFNMAASTGCSRIVMHNYQSKSAFAIRESETLGWQMTPAGRYFTLIRK